MFFHRVRPTVVLVAALAAAVSASAQSITLRGEVEDGPGTSFVMSCTPLTLASGGANLNAVLGEQVEAIGTIIGPDLISVSTVTLVNDIFDVNNNVEVGGEIKWDATGPVGQVCQVWGSVGIDFVPFKGTGLFLNPATMFFVLQATIGADGGFEVEATVPNIPQLANLELSFQIVRLQTGGGFALGNSDCVTVQP